jgi:hypothetical protein
MTLGLEPRPDPPLFYLYIVRSRSPTFHSRQHDWQEDHLLEDNADDDERHPNIVIKRARWLFNGAFTHSDRYS